MLIRKIRVDYFNYSILIAIILSSLTLFISLLVPNSDLRLITVFIYYFFFNILTLLTLAFIITFTPKLTSYFKEVLFLYLTSIYILGYIFSSINFILTGQTIKAQTILFLLKISPPITIFLSTIGLLLIVALFAFIVSRVFSFTNTTHKSIMFSKTIWILSALLLLFFLVFIYPKMNVENNLVRSYNEGDKILLSVGSLGESEILNISGNYLDFNVILILLESVSSEMISFYGYDRNTTPSFESLAKKSIVFKNAYTTATHSDYAQPAFLSSNYLLENNYRNFFATQKNQNAIWQILSKAGYNTYYFSSQDDRWAGMNHYFNYTALDVYRYSMSDNLTDYGIGLGRKDYDHHTLDEALNALNKTYLNCSTASNTTNCYSDINSPYFLYLNFQATHAPINYPEEYRYYTGSSDQLNKQINEYDNSLRYVDLQIGRVLDYLDKNNQTNRTIVIIASDHGQDLYSRHNSYGHGLSIYEDELKIPLSIYIPNQRPLEIVDRISHIDVIPELLSLLNISYPDGLRGSTMKKNKRIFFYTQNHMNLVGMIEGDIKTIIDLNRNLVEVYNLSTDPEEQQDLFSEGGYDSQVLTLLLWHNCQLNYFSVEEKVPKLEKYCEVFRD